MTNRIATPLTADFILNSIKGAVVNRGYSYNKNFSAYVLQFIQPINPAAPVEEPQTEYEIPPIIYIV
jgi:hypothetical protein